MTSRLTRRSMIAAASAAIAVPVVAAPAVHSKALLPDCGVSGVKAAKFAVAQTKMSVLWEKAEALKIELQAYGDDITAKTRDGQIAGWMRLVGEANRLGEERYQTLVTIVNGTPATHADLAIMAQAVLSNELWLGPMTWAGEKLARATVEFNNRVA